MKTLTQFLITLLTLTFASTTLATTSPVGATPGSFAVSPSGAATYSIPIQVPPGVGGMQPNISLVYNSQAGNGIAGVGWNIGGLSAITRCGATIDRDGSKGGVDLTLNDKYCLDGQRLIAISATEYRTEIESFSKVIATGTQGNGPASFTVTSKNGVTTEYGNGNGAQQFVQGNSTTVLSWHVSKIKDVVGNYVQFVYNTDSATSGEHRIDHIDYTYLGTAFVGGVARSVKFNYGGRTDVETSYVGGGAVKTGGRLADYSKDILPAVRITVGSSLVREYRLVYDYSSATQRSRLASVQECGSDGVCLSLSTNFAWSTDQVGYSLSPGSGNLGSGYCCEHMMSDVNGDGKSDIVQF